MKSTLEVESMPFIIWKWLYKYWLLFLALDGSQKELTKELGLKMI